MFLASCRCYADEKMEVFGIREGWYEGLGGFARTDAMFRREGDQLVEIPHDDDTLRALFRELHPAGAAWNGLDVDDRVFELMPNVVPCGECPYFGTCNKRCKE